MYRERNSTLWKKTKTANSLLEQNYAENISHVVQHSFTLMRKWNRKNMYIKNELELGLQETGQKMRRHEEGLVYR